MKWIIWFILICLGVVVLFLLGAWCLGWLDALGNNPNIAIAAGLGILISSALGAGLMALIFYSNRSGADDAAARSQRDFEDRRGQG
ncbi:MAG TPA: hypothetical protein VKB42_14305 [Dongiaceae bacterium]|nr:hypothetical protein [Dongiaceae bacterium]